MMDAVEVTSEGLPFVTGESESESKSATRTLHITLTHSFDISVEASQEDAIQGALVALAEQRPAEFELRSRSGALLELNESATPIHAWLHRKGEKPAIPHKGTLHLETLPPEPLTRTKSEVEEVLELNEDLKMKHLTLKLHKLAEGQSHRSENALTGTQVVEFLVQERQASDVQRAVLVGRRLFKLGVLVSTTREVREFDNKNWLYRVAQVQDSASSDATLWQYLANQPYQERGHAANPLLECLLQGKLQELPQLISLSSPGSLLVVLPVLLVLLPASPFWVQDQVSACVDAIKIRVDENRDLRQFVQFLRNSGWVVSPIFEKVASISKIRAQVLETLLGTLAGLGSLEFVPLPPGIDLLHPFQKGTRCDVVQVLEVFKTNARPCLIDFATQEILPASGNAIEPSISRVTSGTLSICKKGDDLRTDLGCLQVFKLFNYLWRTAGLGFGGVAVQAREYGVVPIGPNIGLIEFVFGCLSLTKIEMLRDKIKTTETLVNLISSAAGAFIGSYVLGVRDRHSDNIIIHKTRGYLFHIDFGHVLGDTVTIDTGPFPITPELKAMIGPVVWPHFVNLCGEAFLTLRKQFALVCNYTELMLSSVASAEKVRAFLKQVFMVDAPPKVALATIKEMIEQAPSSYKTRLKNALHGMVVGKN